jgi:SSS family solute:Na+ symporter
VNWSTDQVLVQRVLAAPNLNEGRKGVVFCQFLKLLTPFVLVLPGLLGFILYRDTIAQPDLAYPVVLKNLMPHGLLGLAIAGLAAALMGHLSATYNSVATLVTRDFYLKWRPNASQKSQIGVGRWAVLFVFLLGVLWVPVIQQFEMMWSYLIRIGIYLLMPYTAVFLAGVLWRRANVAGAWSAVIVGLTMAPIMAVDSKIHFLPVLSESPVFRSYLNSSLLSLAACLIAIVLGSLLTSPPPNECLENTTFSFRKWWGGSYLDEEEPRVSIFGDWRLWFALVVAFVTVIFWVMR